MVEELIENGQYKEALDLLGDLSDENTRYNRLVCLYGIGEYKQAQEEGAKAIAQASKSYYDVVAIYVAILKELQLFDEAIDLLVKELSMPYIPYNYEMMYNHSYDELLIEKREANEGYESFNHALSEDEIENILLRDNVNEELLLMAIQELQTMNIRRLIPAIRMFLQDNNRNNFLKSILIELMIDQEIDDEMVVVKNDIPYDINPSYMPMVISGEAIENIERSLENALEDDNPSLLMQCEEFVRYYLYTIYPRTIDESLYGAIGGAIHYYLATLQDIKVELEDIELWYSCNQEDVLDIIEELKQVEALN